MPTLHGRGHRVPPSYSSGKLSEHASARELLFDLHGRILRLAAARSGLHFQRLACMGRARRLNDKIRKKLARLDGTVTSFKHIAAPLADTSLAEVADDLAGRYCRKVLFGTVVGR